MKVNRIKLFDVLTSYLYRAFGGCHHINDHYLIFRINDTELGKYMDEDKFYEILSISDAIDSNMIKHISFKLKHHNRLLSVEQMIKYESYKKVPILENLISNNLIPEIDDFIHKVKFI